MGARQRRVDVVLIGAGGKTFLVRFGNHAGGSTPPISFSCLSDSTPTARDLPNFLSNLRTWLAQATLLPAPRGSHPRSAVPALSTRVCCRLSARGRRSSQGSFRNTGPREGLMPRTPVEHLP
jgi:hypothetical protein